MSFSIEDAIKLENRYAPTDKDTVQRLAKTTLAPFVGPTASGKNYAMRHTDYHQVGGITTRKLRQNDHKGLRHVKIDEVLVAIKKGELVQYAISENSKTIYATTIDDYNEDKINVKDIYSKVIDNILRCGFKEVRPVATVVHPSLWLPRLDKRFRDLPASIINERLDEAAVSLKWILDDSPQTIKRVLIITDSEEYSQGNRQRIEAFVERHEAINNQEHIEAARQMLAAIPQLKQHYQKQNIKSYRVT